MGTMTFGVFIKTDTRKYTPDTIAKDLFGCSEIYNPLESHLKFGEYVTIFFFENGIEILEPTFGENFVVKDSKEVKKITKYFDNAEFIYGYLVATGCYAYGFRYLENGETKRFRYEDGEGNLFQKGNPLAEELKYLNAHYFNYKEDEEEFVAFSFDGNEEKVDGDYSTITETLVEDIMMSKLGYTYDGNIMAGDICLEKRQYKLPKN